MTTRTVDKGKQKLLEAVAVLKGEPYVRVGILAGADEEGTSLALIASVHEFGREDGSIPERSFFRSTLTEQRERFLERNRKLLGDIAAGGYSPGEALAEVGAVIQGALQERITEGPYVPLAPATIAGKGSTRPLIDEGTMRRAVVFEVVEEGK